MSDHTIQQRKRKAYHHDIYKKISHAQRINVIYLKVVHHQPMRRLVTRTGLRYNSIRNIIEAYKHTGRTNKKNFKTVQAQTLKKNANKPRAGDSPMGTSSDSESFSLIQTMLKQNLKADQRQCTAGSEPQLDLGEINGQKVYLNLAASLQQRADLAGSHQAHLRGEGSTSTKCGLHLFAKQIADSPDLDHGLSTLQDLKVIGSQDANAPKASPEEEEEIIPDDIGVYQNEKEMAGPFTGPLAFLNDFKTNQEIDSTICLKGLDNYASCSITKSLRPNTILS